MPAIERLQYPFGRMAGDVGKRVAPGATQSTQATRVPAQYASKFKAECGLLLGGRGLDSPGRCL